MVKAGPAKGGNDVNGQPLIPELAESLKTCDEPGDLTCQMNMKFLSTLKIIWK
jgi:hypothetical protein